MGSGNLRGLYRADRRSQCRQFYGRIEPQQDERQENGDVYIVASKVVPAKPAALVLNAGVRGTNVELWGMAGNAPDWQARAFGAVALAFTGPSKSSIIFASEAAQQPHHPYD